jgi:hypothetical protein
MKIIGFLLLTILLSAEPATPALQWQTVTPHFNNTLFSFQVPGTPEETSQNDLRFWKVEAGENSYCVAAKPRQCSRGKAVLKPCDFMFLIAEAIPDAKSWKYLKSTKGAQNNSWHIVFTNPAGAFYLVSVCANDNTVIALLTKTDNQASPEHQKLMESFTFGE